MNFLDDFAPSQLKVTVESPTFWRVTFDNPPVNVVGLEMMRELKELLTEIEHNDTVNVVVVGHLELEGERDACVLGASDIPRAGSTVTKVKAGTSQW